MKTSFAITGALAYVIVLASCEEAPRIDVTIEIKAENYHRDGGGSYGDRGRYSHVHQSHGRCGFRKRLG